MPPNPHYTRLGDKVSLHITHTHKAHSLGSIKASHHWPQPEGHDQGLWQRCGSKKKKKTKSQHFCLVRHLFTSQSESSKEDNTASPQVTPPPPVAGSW